MEKDEPRGLNPNPPLEAVQPMPTPIEADDPNQQKVIVPQLQPIPIIPAKSSKEQKKWHLYLISKDPVAKAILDRQLAIYLTEGQKTTLLKPHQSTCTPAGRIITFLNSLLYKKGGNSYMRLRQLIINKSQLLILPFGLRSYVDCPNMKKTIITFLAVFSETYKNADLLVVGYLGEISLPLENVAVPGGVGVQKEAAMEESGKFESKVISADLLRNAEKEIENLVVEHGAFLEWVDGIDGKVGETATIVAAKIDEILLKKELLEKMDK